MTPGVYIANPYEPQQLGSFGKAKYMLLRQHQFPHTYEVRDKLLTADHDRCIMWDYEHATRAFKEHTGTGDMGLEGWLQKAFDRDVIAFLKDVLKADPTVTWTGYRVMGTVNVGNGYAVWTLELFAKHPETTTLTYDGPNFGSATRTNGWPPNVNKPQPGVKKNGMIYENWHGYNDNE